MNTNIHWIGENKYFEIEITEGAGTLVIPPYDETKWRTIADELRKIANDMDPPDEGEKI